MTARFDYEGLHELAMALRRPVSTLLALASTNDPFYAGMPSRRRAEWVVGLWKKFGVKTRQPSPRIHYLLVVRATVRKPDGTPYENTLDDWQFLIRAAGSARHLGLVPPDALIDRRNDAPIINVRATSVDRPCGASRT